MSNTYEFSQLQTLLQAQISTVFLLSQQLPADTHRHAVATVLATQLHAVLPISQSGQSQLGQHEGSDRSLVPYLVLFHVNIVRTDFAQLCPCHFHDADGAAPCE